MYLKSIKNFQTLSNCKTFPPEHEIYLVKRYIEKRIRTLLNNKNNYVYFIATHFNNFYPSCWYVGGLWSIPTMLYYMCDEPFIRDGCIIMKPTDEFVCIDELSLQENKQLL